MSPTWRSSIIRAGRRSWRIDKAGRVCLIRQFRHAAGGWIWELPAGKLEPQEPPLETARRELVEEAGNQRTPGSHWGLMSVRPEFSPKSCTCTSPAELDSVNMAHEAGELIEVHWVDLGGGMYARA